MPKVTINSPSLNQALEALGRIGETLQLGLTSSFARRTGARTEHNY